MPELLISAEYPKTCAEFRERWNGISEEHRFQYVCAMVDLAQAGRVINREYMDRDGTYSGINHQPWSIAKVKWEALGLALRNFFGADWCSSAPQPPLILLNPENALTRSIVKRNQTFPDARQAQALMGRYWINQPSKSQDDHKWHGRLVYAPKDFIAGIVTVYFTDHDIEFESCQMSTLSLSPGWPEHLRKR